MNRSLCRFLVGVTPTLAWVQVWVLSICKEEDYGFA